MKMLEQYVWQEMENMDDGDDDDPNVSGLSSILFEYMWVS